MYGDVAQLGDNQFEYGSGSKVNRRAQELNDLYYGNNNVGEGRRAGTAASSGQRFNSRTKNLTRDIENERKAVEEIDLNNPQELDIYGRPKHQFYNEELEIKTKAIQDQFAELYAQLQCER